VCGGVHVQEGRLAVDTTIARLPLAFVACSITSRPTQPTNPKDSEYAPLTCSATCTGYTPSSLSSHSSVPNQPNT